MTFHVKLIKLRKGQGHTQSTFAEAVGVSRQSVYKWETGQSYPDVEKLLKIARLFGVTVDELIDDALPCRFTDKAPVEAPAEEKPAELLDFIRANGAKASISIKPGTPAKAVFPYLDRCDMILVMTVEPGYGGQALIPETLNKVAEIRAEIERKGLVVDIQVDGGITPGNAKDAISAGANVLVAGSSVFKSEDRKAAIDALRG